MEKSKIQKTKCVDGGLEDLLKGKPFVFVTKEQVVNKKYRSEERRVGKECRSRWSPYH